MSRLTRCLLFDWGNTLMRELPEYAGAMATWPRVEAVPHAAQVLAHLHSHWLLAMATNAEVSDETQIRAALARASLDQYIHQIYCFRRIGHKKPAPEFFHYILKDLGMDGDNVVMVGDSFESDVLGANRAGMCAVWFNEHSAETRKAETYVTIHSLTSLPQALETLGFGRQPKLY